MGQGLKSALRKVELAEENLYATRVERGEEHPYPMDEVSASYMRDKFGEDADCSLTWRDKDKEVPDEELRERSKKRLEEMYKGSRYFSVRYLAGLALGKDNLALAMNNWLIDLRGELNAEKKEYETVERGYDKINPNQGVYEFVREGYDHIEVGKVPDVERRKEALEDAAYLFKFTKRQDIEKMIEEKGGHSELLNIVYGIQPEEPTSPWSESLVDSTITGITLGCAPLVISGIASLIPEFRELYDNELARQVIIGSSILSPFVGAAIGFGIGKLRDRIE